ncbi:MAG TPA: DUF5677 domain-containing protein [Balneolaceae bacterium]|nr:DUF5677 domain-containing protein [Balneolaceae bacterium]
MTESLKSILDRELSLANSREMRKIVSPLIIEVVNYSTNAFGRYASLTKHHRHEDLSILILFIHTIEMMDSIEVLISRSISEPAQLILRSLFEATLGIDYLLQDEKEYLNRSYAWLINYVHNKIKSYKSISDHSKNDSSLPRALNEHENELVQEITKELPDPSDAIENLETFFNKPYIKNYAAEFKEENPRHWYSFRSGPQNLKLLSRKVGREAEYMILYKYWSTISHTSDLQRFPGKTKNGESGIKMIRNPEKLQDVASYSITFMLRTLRKLMMKFSPGEENAFKVWYTQNVQEGYLEITPKSY